MLEGARRCLSPSLVIVIVILNSGCGGLSTIAITTTIAVVSTSERARAESLASRGRLRDGKGGPP